MDSRTMKALASDKKREILKILSADQFTLSDISKKLGLSVSTAKEHLDDLCKAGLIEQKDEGRKWKYYVLTKTGKSLLSPVEKKILLMLGLSSLAVLSSSWLFLSRFFTQTGEGSGLLMGVGAEYVAKDSAAYYPVAESLTIPYLEIIFFAVSMLILGICIGYILNNRKIRNHYLQ